MQEPSNLRANEFESTSKTQKLIDTWFLFLVDILKYSSLIGLLCNNLRTIIDIGDHHDKDVITNLLERKANQLEGKEGS